jgi:hypothetical protein
LYIFILGDKLTVRGQGIKLGPGLQQFGEQVQVNKVGILQKGTNGKLWIQSAQKRVNKTYKHDKYKQI